MIPQLTFGWLTKDGQEMFSGKVDAGLKGMKGNSHFTTLASAVTDCETSYDTYLVAKADAMQGGKVRTAARNTARGSLVSLLRPLLGNANALANGDEAMLFSTDFAMRKTKRTPVGPLHPPAAPKLLQGKVSGTMVASNARVYGASMYTVRLALASAPQTYLQTRQGTGTRFAFEGLTPGELYNVDMNAIGAAGPSDWSDLGTIRVI